MVLSRCDWRVFASVDQVRLSIHIQFVFTQRIVIAPVTRRAHVTCRTAPRTSSLPFLHFRSSERTCMSATTGEVLPLVSLWFFHQSLLLSDVTARTCDVIKVIDVNLADVMACFRCCVQLLLLCVSVMVTWSDYVMFSVVSTC